MRSDIEHLLAADSGRAVWDRFATITAARGYPHLCYVIHRFGNHAGRPKHGWGDCRMNVPLPLAQNLRDGPSLSKLPWLLWSCDNGGARALRRFEADQTAPYLTDEGRKLVEVIRRNRMLAGHAVSLLGLAAHMTGVVMFMPAAGTDQAEADRLWRGHGKDLTALAGIMHLRTAALPFASGQSGLTPRQREVVEWAAQGKTMAEIAHLLGVEATTVEKHLRLAREALDAATTAQAVMRAYLRNLIFVGNQHRFPPR